MDTNGLVGRYNDQMTQAVADAGKPTDDYTKHNSLFRCDGGSSGLIKYMEFCDHGCSNNGHGKNDTCN